MQCEQEAFSERTLATMSWRGMERKGYLNWRGREGGHLESMKRVYLKVNAKYILNKIIIIIIKIIE